MQAHRMSGLITRQLDDASLFFRCHVVAVQATCWCSTLWEWIIIGYSWKAYSFTTCSQHGFPLAARASHATPSWAGVCLWSLTLSTGFCFVYVCVLLLKTCVGELSVTTHTLCRTNGNWQSDKLGNGLYCFNKRHVLTRRCHKREALTPAQKPFFFSYLVTILQHRHLSRSG